MSAAWPCDLIEHPAAEYSSKQTLAKRRCEQPGGCRPSPPLQHSLPKSNSHLASTQYTPTATSALLGITRHYSPESQHTHSHLGITRHYSALLTQSQHTHSHLGITWHYSALLTQSQHTHSHLGIVPVGPQLNGEVPSTAADPWSTMDISRTYHE